MIKKKIATYWWVICVFVITTGGLCFSCSKADLLPQNASISFEKTKHDFGEIPEKVEASVVFNFENDSEHPLIINDVKTSCGCAAPEWPKESLDPSGKGEIKVTYDAKYPGRFNKTITVFYNGKDSPQQLTIKGLVPFPKTQQ